jgi:transposase
MSQREAARHFNISRDSVAKMMAFSVPPGYRRTAPVKRPKLDAFTGIIDGWLEDDHQVHRKQRHTAKRVFERLRDEHGFTGGYTIVKDYIRERERRGREVFVPLAHPPGHAQADFGEAVVVIGGVEQKAHFFVMDLPHSDACYVRAYPAATAEAWVDGHVHAFAFFGKVPVSVVYDNDRCLVAKILPDGTRQRATLFSGFLSHYLFRDRYGRPGKGNDKGNVEGLVGFSRRNFMVPIPRFATWDAFNTYLEEQCERRGRRMSCAASPRRSVNGSPAIWPRWPTCRRRRSMPATKPLAGSAPRRWCATRPTITRCRSLTATVTSGSGAMSASS